MTSRAREVTPGAEFVDFARRDLGSFVLTQRKTLMSHRFLLVALSMLLLGCARDDRVAQLERRVDSLAVTLTALVNSSRRAEAPALSESLTVSLHGAAVAGDPRAPVVIVEFTDYQCPFCSRHFTSTFPEIRTQYVQ